MLTEKKLRRKDRALSRKMQQLVFQGYYSNKEIELFLKLKDLIDSGGSEEEVDIIDYSTIELVKVERLLNIHVFQPKFKQNPRFQYSQGNEPSYNLKMGGCLLKITPKPFHAHFGNCIVQFKQYLHGLCFESGAPNYGEIYKEIKALCINNGKFDELYRQAIAQMMLEFVKKGPRFYSDLDKAEYKVKRTYTGYAYDDTNEHTFSVSLSNSTKVELTLNDEDLNYFYGVCYLIFIRESTRRMAGSDYYEKGKAHYGKDLPFFVANFRTLKLLEAGEIKFSEFLSRDSSYGVSTGENIISFGVNKLAKTKSKFKTINEQYKEKFFSLGSFKEIKDDFEETFPGKLAADYDVDISDQDCWSDDDIDGRPRKSTV